MHIFWPFSSEESAWNPRNFARHQIFHHALISVRPRFFTLSPFPQVTFLNCLSTPFHKVMMLGIKTSSKGICKQTCLANYAYPEDKFYSWPNNNICHGISSVILKRPSEIFSRYLCECLLFLSLLASPNLCYLFHFYFF